jgi:RNA polymerase sigma-70 factor, ECF subfamily
MSPEAPESDDELLLGMHSGDEHAFVTLYRRRQGAIYRFVLHMTGSVALAEDVTQEVFLALIRDGCGYDPERGTLAGYLYGIARKLVLRHAARSRSLVALENEGDDGRVPDTAVTADPLAELTRRESIDALRKAVQVLPRVYREVVVLCDLEELDYSQAAEALSCPVGTIRSRLHRARALLLEKLHEDRNSRPRVGALKLIRGLI